jgi:hypothetical protein
MGSIVRFTNTEGFKTRLPSELNGMVILSKLGGKPDEAPSP